MAPAKAVGQGAGQGLSVWGRKGATRMNGQAVERHRARWGPACGVLFVVLLVISFLVTSTPNTNKSPQYLLAWYNKSSHKTALAVSTILADIAVVFGIFWFGYLRDR